MAWDGFAATGGGKFPALHARARGINLSPFPKLAFASSRRSSISSRIDSRSDPSASSSVSPWPLPSGNSGENAMNHFPSRTIRTRKFFLIGGVPSRFAVPRPTGGLGLNSLLPPANPSNLSNVCLFYLKNQP